MTGDGRDYGCRKTRAYMALVVGADLPQDKDRPVRAHLAACPACQRELGRYLRARQALRQLDAPAYRRQVVDAQFFGSMDPGIRARLSEPRPRLRFRILGRRWVSALLTGAALFLLGVGLVSAFSIFAPRPSGLLERGPIQPSPRLETPGGRLQNVGFSEGLREAHGAEDLKSRFQDLYLSWHLDLELPVLSADRASKSQPGQPGQPGALESPRQDR